MKPASDSQRLLKALNEQDQAFRKLATSPAINSVSKAGRELNARLAEVMSPIQKVAEQLQTPQYQRAIDIARQLSDASSGLSVSKPPTPRIAAPRMPASVERVRSVAELGALVRRARKAMKMKQSEFAAHAGVGRRFVSELEGGKPSLEFDRVMACAQAAGIDLTARLRSR
ncbi:helix-turn-helix transcriptional regulator [Qipengyuania marisflavi]|nr:helix-turn-helix transcriptional regulator [Qipengyuania marisflavi]